MHDTLRAFLNKFHPHRVLCRGIEWGPVQSLAVFDREFHLRRHRDIGHSFRWHPILLANG